MARRSCRGFVPWRRWPAVVDCERFAEEVASGQLPASEIARQVESFVLDGWLSGAARMARTWLCLFPGSQFIRRVAAWYVSLWSGYRVFPFRQGRAFDAAAEEWEPSGAVVERLKRQCWEVPCEGVSRRGSLLMV